MSSELLTASEVAAYFRVSKATILRWCAEGRIPAIRIGREWRIPADELQKMVLARGHGGEKPVKEQDLSWPAEEAE